jgi:hypothetical protein
MKSRKFGSTKGRFSHHTLNKDCANAVSCILLDASLKDERNFAGSAKVFVQQIAFAI